MLLIFLYNSYCIILYDYLLRHNINYNNIKLRLLGFIAFSHNSINENGVQNTISIIQYIKIGYMNFLYKRYKASAQNYVGNKSKNDLRIIML